MSRVNFEILGQVSTHFSPDASKCEMASEAYSLTDGNWPDRSVSLRRLLDQSKLGRRSGLHLGAQSTAPKEPEVPKASGVEPLTAQTARGVQSDCL